MAVGRRVIIPDYRRPQALLVPHYHSTILTMLEAIAEQAANFSGVILLSQDTALSDAFVASCSSPELFHVISAPFDTPWLRDRSPIAVKQGDQVHWVLPRLDTDDRPLDEQLFSRIVQKPVEDAAVSLPHGNLVAGPRGRAVVMLQQAQDETEWREQLQSLNQLLGVRDWILAGGFEQEITGHADVHMRFLGPKLAAVAWNEDNPDDQQCCIALEHALLASLPNLDIIRLPLRSEDGHYASPLNWLQFGKQLLVPRYPLTPAADIRTIEQRLQQAGFKSRFIYSPTLEYAGSLHCLTASLYV